MQGFTSLRSLKQVLPYKGLRFKKGSLLGDICRGVGSSLVIRTTGYFLVFASQLLTARYLSTESFGQFWYSVTLLTTLAVFGKSGFDTATVRFLPTYLADSEKPLARAFLRHRTSMVVGTSSLVGACLIVATVALWGRLDRGLASTLVVGALCLPLLCQSQMYEDTLRAIKRIRIAQVPLSIVRPLVFLSSFFLLAHLRPFVGAPLSMVAFALAYLFATTVLVRLLPKATIARAEEVAVINKHWEWNRTAWSLMLVSAFTLALAQADILLVGVLIDTKTSGSYIVASKLASMLIFVLAAVNFVLGPMASAYFHERRINELQRSVSIAIRLSLGASLLLISVLIVFGRQLLILFGPEFVSAYPVLLYLLAGQLINASTGPVALLLNVTGYHRSVMRILGYGAAGNIVLNAVLIPVYGTEGAAIATSASLIVVNLVMARELRTKVAIRTLSSLFKSVN